MTKKHFEFAAARIRAIRNASQRCVALDVAVDLLCEFGPRFDVQRFIAACQPKAD